MFWFCARQARSLKPIEKRKAIDYRESNSETSEAEKESDFEAEKAESEAEEISEADLSKRRKKEQRGALETDDEQMDDPDNAERRRTAARMRFSKESEFQVFVLEKGNEWYVGRLISGSRKYGKVKGTLLPETQARLEAGEILELPEKPLPLFPPPRSITIACLSFLENLAIITLPRHTTLM